jgi:hypothetical protein
MAEVGDKFQFTYKECLSIRPAQLEWPKTYTIVSVDKHGHITSTASWESGGFSYRADSITIIKGKEMFKVGDKVMISPSSEYFTDLPGNPKETEGTVTRVVPYDDHSFGVTWDNGHDNSYRASDLVLSSLGLFTTTRGVRGLTYICGGTTLTKSARRSSKGEEQYVIKYEGSSGNLNVVTKSDLPALAAAIIELL